MAVGMLVLAAIMFRRMNIRSALQAFFSVMIILTATIVHPPVGQLDESIGSAYSEQETGARRSGRTTVKGWLLMKT